MKQQVCFVILSALICFASSKRTIICNKYCDYIAASELPTSEELYSFKHFGRTVTLYGQQEGLMIFGRLTNGKGGDEMWLERYFTSWQKWFKIGAVTVGNGSTVATTAGFNVDGNLIPEGRLELFGSIRVCAKPHENKRRGCSNARRVPICMNVCDKVDRSLLKNETILLVENVDGRRIEVIASLKENVIYGHLSHGQFKDEIWLDRILMQGEEWIDERKLGLNTILTDSTEVYTPAFNVNYKAGVPIFGSIRVCVRTKDVHCTKYLRSPICNKLCDGDQPIKDLVFRIKAEKERLGRKICVLASDDETDGVAFGRVEGYHEVWLERSWDDGKSWEGPLGQTNLSFYSHYTNSKVFHYNRRKPIVQAGQIRACAKLEVFNIIFCTEWTTSTTATTTTTEEPSSEVVEDYPEDSRIVTFEDCALAIIDHMKQTEDRLYYSFARISQDEAVTKFKKLFCKNYGWQEGNCNRCFREVFS